jgi:hypothetical protein
MQQRATARNRAAKTRTHQVHNLATYVAPISPCWTAPFAKLRVGNSPLKPARDAGFPMETRMKQLLIATVAAAALATAAPAFAQDTQDPATPTPQAQSETPQVSTAPTPPPIEPANPAADDVTATPPADTTATPETTEERMPTASGDAETTTEAEASAEAETTVAPPASRTAANGQLNVELPAQVDAAIADGNYTPDDLNRAQLAALSGPTTP